MSNQSNNNGRGFEYITLKTFEGEISKICKVEVDETGSVSKVGVN